MSLSRLFSPPSIFPVPRLDGLEDLLDPGAEVHRAEGDAGRRRELGAVLPPELGAGAVQGAGKLSRAEKRVDDKGAAFTT